MTPKKHGPEKPKIEDFVEPIRLTELFFLKSSARSYYINIEPKTVRAYGLVPGDILKIQLVEARKHREFADSEEKTEWKEEE